MSYLDVSHQPNEHILSYLLAPRKLIIHKENMMEESS